MLFSDTYAAYEATFSIVGHGPRVSFFPVQLLSTRRTHFSHIDCQGNLKAIFTRISSCYTQKLVC